MKDILQVKNAGFDSKVVTLENKETGDVKKFILREFLHGDEEGIVACIKSEYGDTYFKRFFYDPRAFRERAEGTGFIFFVAECDKRVAGITILRFFTGEGDDYIEPCSQIIAPEYRGYDLAKNLVEYIFAIAIDLNPSALFVRTNMYHNIVQHVCESYGMVPVGFEIGVFFRDAMKNSYPMGSPKKYSAGTLVYPVKKRDAGQIFLPVELKDYADFIYKKLGVTVEIKTEAESCDTELHCKLMEEEPDRLNRYAAFIVRRYGQDLEEKLREIMKKDEEMWTFLVVLPAENPDIIPTYKMLRSLGFFFGGLQPVCGEHEYVYMYHVGDLELYMEEYVVTEAFGKIRDLINEYYRGR
ncbi:MAG: GNAT family N-acetyltransferase [Lachnospiraceae bacterium]|nr:GNAT family N-acetyltransferase [Lachnospiraceae bacterium]